MTQGNLFYWKQPKSRDVGSFGGISVYIQVLQFSEKETVISIDRLISEEIGLGQRLRGLLIINKVTPTIANDAIKELEAYGWIRKIKAETDKYVITPEGEKMSELAKTDLRQFKRILAVKMYDRFVIPGWFLYRLLELNPNRQGEIVLPTPIREKDLSSRKWEEVHWSRELEEMAIESVNIAKSRFPGAFPVNINDWIFEVKKTWHQLGEAKRKRVAKIKKEIKPSREKPKVERFSARRRLSLAMREASISILFGNISPVENRLDFESSKHPIPPRSFQSWCPILEALEFIFYSDHHSEISGRLIFPCGGFRKTISSDFEEINEIKEPYSNISLKLYQPEWYKIRSEFTRSLQDVYILTSRKKGSLYISLLEIRDEVCRRLRLSSVLFDKFLENLYRESIRESIIDGKTFSLSLESDIRPDQQSGSNLLRRPVYVDKVPYSLIAISTGKVRK